MVFPVPQLAVPAAQRNSHDLYASPLERLYFASDESVADHGILGDQIGNVHGVSLVFNETRPALEPIVVRNTRRYIPYAHEPGIACARLIRRELTIHDGYIRTLCIIIHSEDSRQMHIR